MITKPEATQLKAAVRRLVRATVNHSWRGSGNPEDVSEIEAELKAAKKSYKKLVEKLTVTTEKLQ